jgi:hypothetical protein
MARPCAYSWCATHARCGVASTYRPSGGWANAVVTPRASISPCFWARTRVRWCPPPIPLSACVVAWAASPRRLVTTRASRRHPRGLRSSLGSSMRSILVASCPSTSANVAQKLHGRRTSLGSRSSQRRRARSARVVPDDRPTALRDASSGSTRRVMRRPTASSVWRHRRRRVPRGRTPAQRRRSLPLVPR